MKLGRSADQVLHAVLRRARFARFPRSYSANADLAVIGDRHTAALITREGEIVWYCPGRLDAPSLLGAILDPAIGGAWRVDLPGATPLLRRYVGESAVLETVLHHPRQALTITDWLNLPREGTPGSVLCRKLSAAPADLRLVLTPRPDYARRIPRLRRATETRIAIDDRFQLQMSHAVSLNGAAIETHVPRGEESWAMLSDTAAVTAIAERALLEQWLAVTLDGWRLLAGHCPYQGVYRDQVHASLRALRLLVHETTGAIAAAVSTSLPEVIGGRRNFDYRYSWLRDSGLIVRALARFDTGATEARRYLGFIAGLHDTGHRKPLDPVSAIGGERVPSQVRLGLAGYRASPPIWAGNKAAKQLQLGSLAAFLLAARELYERAQPREHWRVVSRVADYEAAASK